MGGVDGLDGLDAVGLVEDESSVHLVRKIRSQSEQTEG